MKDVCYLVLNSAGIQSLRKTRPALSAGQVAVRLVVEVDDSYFRRAIPTAELTIPADYLIEPEIIVELEQEGVPDTPPTGEIDG
jgi:hypothetical protein